MKVKTLRLMNVCNIHLTPVLVIQDRLGVMFWTYLQRERLFLTIT